MYSAKNMNEVPQLKYCIYNKNEKTGFYTDKILAVPFPKCVPAIQYTVWLAIYLDHILASYRSLPMSWLDP